MALSDVEVKMAADREKLPDLTHDMLGYAKIDYVAATHWTHSILCSRAAPILLT